MSRRSLIEKVPFENNTLNDTGRDTELPGMVTTVAIATPTVSRVQPCDCPYCRCYAGITRLRNVSTLAAVDVYSLPDEAEVCRRPPQNSH